jgi:type IV pilus assembly protein PilM
MFSNRKNPTTVVGLDLEAGSIAATELRGNGSEVARAAIEPLAPGIVNEGEVQDLKALSDALRSLFSGHKLSKDVRLGVANQRLIVRTLRLPLIEDPKEIDTAVRFQAQDQIGMPLDQAVLDHEVVARTRGGDGAGGTMDVLTVAARRDMVASLIAALSEAGLRPAGIDVAAFGIIRALSGEANPLGDVDSETTTLYCYFGDITNLAVARGQTCLFTRIAPFGIGSIAEALAKDQGVPLEDAREWLLEVGLEESLESFESERSSAAAAARRSLEEGASKLVDELRLSLEFYGAQEGVPAIERLIVCGPGSRIDGLPERIQTGLGRGIESMTPRALSQFDGEDAARLTVSYGLAMGA